MVPDWCLSLIHIILVEKHWYQNRLGTPYLIVMRIYMDVVPQNEPFDQIGFMDYLENTYEFEDIELTRKHIAVMIEYISSLKQRGNGTLLSSPLHSNYSMKGPREPKVVPGFSKSAKSSEEVPAHGLKSLDRSAGKVSEVVRGEMKVKPSSPSCLSMSWLHMEWVRIIFLLR